LKKIEKNIGITRVPKKCASKARVRAEREEKALPGPGLIPPNPFKMMFLFPYFSSPKIRETMVAIVPKAINFIFWDVNILGRF